MTESIFPVGEVGGGGSALLAMLPPASSVLADILLGIEPPSRTNLAHARWLALRRRLSIDEFCGLLHSIGVIDAYGLLRATDGLARSSGYGLSRVGSHLQQDLADVVQVITYLSARAMTGQRGNGLDDVAAVHGARAKTIREYGKRLRGTYSDFDKVVDACVASRRIVIGDFEMNPLPPERWKSCIRIVNRLAGHPTRLKRQSARTT